MIKVAVFDLDDTLYYEKEYVLEAFREVCNYLSEKYNKDSDILYKQAVEILEVEGRGKIFNILCEKNNIDENILKLVDIYRNSKPELNLYEESKNIFNYAKMRGLKIGIITDGCSKVQWNKIKALSLEKIVEKIIVTDDYGKGFEKPHKKSYIEIINCFNVRPEECVYVGDNPKKDFIGAKELGMRTIRIIHEKGDHIYDKVDTKYEADEVIYNLNQLKEIFIKEI